MEQTSELVTFNNGVAEISDFQKVGMPGAKKEVSKKEFFSILADNIQRFMGKSKKIGFCFSYAAEITPDHDGCLVVAICRILLLRYNHPSYAGDGVII